jgi:arsenate reductase-like glutaredoxin family protein
VKEFLSQHHVDYVERNIAADESTLAELVTLGYQTTPVTLIDGEAVIGFNAARINELLGL